MQRNEENKPFATEVKQQLLTLNMIFYMQYDKVNNPLKHINEDLANKIMKAVFDSVKGCIKRSQHGADKDFERFTLFSFNCDQDNRSIMEGLLRDTHGVGATFINMESEFNIEGLWVMPKNIEDNTIKNNLQNYKVHAFEDYPIQFLNMELNDVPETTDQKNLRNLLTKFWYKSKYKAEFKWFFDF